MHVCCALGFRKLKLVFARSLAEYANAVALINTSELFMMSAPSMEVSSKDRFANCHVIFS